MFIKSSILIEFFLLNSLDYLPPYWFFLNFISFKISNFFHLWKTCLSYGMAIPSIVPRQTSPLDLQIKLPATADAAQADPTSRCAASLLSCLGKLSWGWEAGPGKLPIKKLSSVLCTSSFGSPVPAFPCLILPSCTHHTA